MTLFRRLSVGLILSAGLGFSALVASTSAQGPKKKDPEPAPASRVNWHEKKIAFEMRGKEWRTVFEWLADQSGMPYASPYPAPVGTFTFINPTINGKPREYTLAEAFDIINEILQGSTKHTLIRREVTLTMFPADVEIPETYFPQVRVEDLPKRGKTEIVRTIVTVKNQNAEDIAGQVKKWLGDFGQVTPLPDTNQLIIRGTVASLLLTREILLPDEPPQTPHTHAHKCQYMRASAAAAVVTQSLGAPQAIERISSKDGDGGGGPFGKGPPGGGTTRQRIVRPHTITSEKATNTVIIHGPADKVQQAKEVLSKIDVPRFDGDKGVLVGPPEFQNHDLPGGGAESTAKLLSEVYKDDPSVRILVVNPSRLFVHADPQTHWDLKKIIAKEFQPTLLKAVMIPLFRQDPLIFAESLKGMLKDGPFIEADRDNNGLRVRGTEEQIRDVNAIVKAFDESPFAGAGNVRMINLDKGSGATVAEALYLLLPKLRTDATFKLILPGQFETPDFREKKDDKKKDEEKKPDQKKLTTQLTPNKVRELMYVKDPRTVAPPSPVSFTSQEGKKDEPKQPAKKGPTVIITGFGNRIMVSSDDPQALDLAQQMIRILVNTEAGPGDFEVLRLKVANAVEIAKILDEAFNGKSTGGGGGQRGGGGGLQIPGLSTLTSLIPGMGGGQQGRVENIRIVADPQTNALLIRAKPIDMLTIRRLLDKHLDVDDIEVPALVKTHVIGPLKHANAVEVADLIRSVYAESMNPRPQQSSGGGFSGFGGFGGPRPVDSGGTRQVALTVGVDNRTNSLYVSCTTNLFNDIEKLVTDIEKSSSESKQAIKIISVPDIDPALVQQAIAAISGQSLPATSSRTSTAGATFGGTGTGRTFGPGGNFGGFSNTFGGGTMILPFGGGQGGFQGIGGTPGTGRTFGPGGGTPGTGRTFGPGGGGGGIRTTPPGGGGGGTKGRQSRGPDFFEQRVMDDPSVAVLFDPSEQQEPNAPLTDDLAKNPSLNEHPVQLAGALQPKELGAVTMIDAKGVHVGTWTLVEGTITLTFPRVAIYTGKITGSLMTGTARDDAFGAWKWNVSRVGAGSNEWNGNETRPGYGKLTFRFSGAGPAESGLSQPRLPVQVEVLPELGIAILRANNQADLEVAMEIIDRLRKEAQGAKVDIRMVPVRFADVMQVTNQLNQLFGRVAFNPSSTVLIGSGVTAVVPTQSAGGGLLPGGVTQSPIQPTQQASAQARNMIFLPQPRLAAILVAAPSSRMQEVIEKIHMLDQPHSQAADLVPIPLKRASAARVANALNTFYATRFATADNPPALSQVRVAWDDRSNTIFVQGSFNDINDIRRFVEYIDSNNPGPKADMRVVPLKNAVAAELAQVLQLSIANGILTINQQQALAGALPGGGGIPGGGAIPGGAQAGTGLSQQFGLMFKDQTVRFIPSNSKEGKPIEAGILEDIRVTPYGLTNSLVVVAPDTTMPLLLALIRDLDVPPNARSEINIFTLKRADATQMALMLQQLFVGTGALGAGATAAGGGAVPGGGVVPGGGAAAAGAQQRAPITITIQQTTPEGAPIIDLRVTVDERTNSLIVAGSRNDLRVVETIIYRLEDEKMPRRMNETVRLRNANSVDVANAVNDFYTKTNAIYTKYLQGTNSLQILRDVVVTAEPISNSLMISATPEYFDEVLRNVAKLDTTPPQVVISVLIAEVTLDGSEEFGVEVGLQNPLMFSRTLLPTGAATTYSTLGSPAVNDYALNFLNNFGGATPLNAGASPNAVATQGLSTLGVGRVSSTRSVGGFVFSAANESVNVLIRALKTQNRLNVLSRPQIMALDNQAAVLAIGTEIPLITGGTTIVNGAVTTPGTTRKTIGVTLQVTPRITPDGRILMRVIPEVSSVASVVFPLGNGQFGTSLNIQHLETTVSAFDGDTILLGGIITDRDNKTENKIPWLGDLPGVGAAFRFRTETRNRTELIIIMTPHIVRNREEAELILAEESKRISWNVPDVMRVHGSRNCSVFEPHVFTGPQPQPYRIAPGLTPGLEDSTSKRKTVVPFTQPQTRDAEPSPPRTLPPAQPQTSVPAPQTSRLSPAASRGGLLQNLFTPRSRETRELWAVESAPAHATAPLVRVEEETPAPLPTVVSTESRIAAPPPVALPQK